MGVALFWWLARVQWMKLGVFGPLPFRHDGTCALRTTLRSRHEGQPCLCVWRPPLAMQMSSARGEGVYTRLLLRFALPFTQLSSRRLVHYSQ